MSRSHRRSVGLTTSLAILTSVALSRAATPSELEHADAHFKQGVQLFKAGTYDAALVEFRKAQSTVPDWHVLFNIGRTCSELHDAACAIGAYRSYLRQADQLPNERVAEVQAELARLQPAVGVVHVSAPEPNAELSLDDRPLDGTESTSGVVVNIGQHRFSARFASGTGDSRVVDGASGDDITVALVPPRAPAAAAPYEARPGPVSLPPPAARPERDTTPFPLWTGWVATSAFAAGGAASGILALSARSQAKRDATNPSGQSGLDASNAKTHRLAAVTDALFGAAAVCGVVTLYFTLKAPSPKGQVAFEVAPSAVRLGYQF